MKIFYFLLLLLTLTFLFLSVQVCFLYCWLVRKYLPDKKWNYRNYRYRNKQFLIYAKNRKSGNIAVSKRMNNFLDEYGAPANLFRGTLFQLNLRFIVNSFMLSVPISLLLFLDNSSIYHIFFFIPFDSFLSSVSLIALRITLSVGFILAFLFEFHNDWKNEDRERLIAALDGYIHFLSDFYILYQVETASDFGVSAPTKGVNTNNSFHSVTSLLRFLMYLSVFISGTLFVFDSLSLFYFVSVGRNLDLRIIFLVPIRLFRLCSHLLLLFYIKQLYYSHAILTIISHCFHFLDLDSTGIPLI